MVATAAGAVPVAQVDSDDVVVEGRNPTDVHADDMDDEFTFFHDNSKDTCFLVLIIIGVIVFCATVAESFHYVQYNEQALLQNQYSGVRLSRVYDTGRYFFPLNYKLITFPSNYMLVKFDTLAFTDTGLELEVEIGFYYRIPKSTLGDVYDSFSTNYNDRVESNAKTTIKNTAADLGIDMYLTNRSYVESLFATAVNEVLWKNVLVEAPTELFRIGEVVLPDSVLARSLESNLAVQRNEILANEQEVTRITSETDRLVSIINAKSEQLSAFATNQATRLEAEAESYANQVNIRARGTGIAALINSLSFNTSQYTMDIVKRLGQIDNADATTVVNVDNTGASVLVNS